MPPVSTPRLTIRPGHPDFLDLDWGRPIEQWEGERIVDLPTGLHRHPIVFVSYTRDIYAIKELSLEGARHEYRMLRGLRDRDAPSVEPVGLAERPWLDPTEEGAGAVITRYLDYSFSYRELVSGAGFGDRRSQMLDAFANLLVELHLLSAFWGDCSLSNVLYRFDAEGIEVRMVDGETVQLYDSISEGRREEDLGIMIENIAGAMADIAAGSEDLPQWAKPLAMTTALDDADLELGEDIAARYRALWDEVTQDEPIGPDEHYKISERIERLNELGFQVDDIELIPDSEGISRLRLHLKAGGRTFHRRRLAQLTGIEASELQARQILADLRYYEARYGVFSPSGKAVTAIQWRAGVFEPLLERVTAAVGPTGDPVQGYVDFLHHRYAISEQAGHDVANEEAFEDWVAKDRPGYPLA
jgi:hypothetical protein